MLLVFILSHVGLGVISLVFVTCASRLSLWLLVLQFTLFVVVSGY